MASADEQKPMYLGMFTGQGEGGALTISEILVMIFSAVWVVGMGLYFLLAPTSPDPGMQPVVFGVSVLAIIVPVVLVWIGLSVQRNLRRMRSEAERLQAAITALRQAYIQQQQSGVLEMTPAFERKLEEIAAAQKKTDEKLARFTSIRPAMDRPAPGTDGAALGPSNGTSVAPENAGNSQPSLALGTPAESMGPPLSMTDFIKALNFPDNPEDKEGFRALRRALQDRATAQLIQAAQDVLTLLSQDGIYMDDLNPDRARPEIWRRFARGERGKSVAILGGIRDRSSLALSAGRMRQDTIFRDSVHHFLRKFDHTFTEFEKSASDLEIAALTETRSARAFMLLGRVTGTFD